ncbi:MAG: M15 family metallopeptidase [Pseudolabrys sp.]|nr:M15 family metallopeptidase [Pseudolabrys sp.]
MTRAVIALVMMALATSAQAASPLVYLRDIDPSIAQDMRYAGRDNFTGKALPGYNAPECMLLRPVALALQRVQAELTAANLSLKVYDCYRPARATGAMAAWARDPKPAVDTTRFYPALDKSKLFALGYISNFSAHSRGVAVDLTIVPRGSANPAFDANVNYGPCTAPQAQRASDNSLDMGTGYDCFDTRSHTRSAAISAAQAANRRVLLDAMQKHGFSNYKREWWHFSLNSADSGVAYDLPVAPR